MYLKYKRATGVLFVEFVYICGFLGIIDGFIEVGIYSKLQAIQHLDQSGRIQGWKTTGSPGLKSHSVEQERALFSEVNAPIPGTYYVSTTLILQTLSSDRLKVSILVNNDPKRKTGLTGLGSPNSSVAVTGVVQLQLQDSLSVYIQFQNGSTLTVFPESTFFVQLVHSLTSYPAFRAVLSRDFSDLSASVWRRVESWDTTANGFQVLSGFSPSTGTYCACCDGIYLIHGNVVLDPLTSRNVSVGLFLRNQTVISEEHCTTGKNQSANVGGIFYLKKGECLDVRTRSFQGSHSVVGGSGFSLLYLSSTSSLLHAGSYRLDAHASLMSTAGLYTLDGWTTGGSSVLFASSAQLLVSNNSKYQVQTEGQYLISAQVNFKSMTDDPSQSVQLLVIINQTPSSGPSDASIVAKQPISVVTSLAINGILFLSKGQKISVCVYKDGNTLVTSMAGSLFSVAMVPKDWPGVSATLSSNQLLSRQGWNELGAWQTGSLTGGLFSFDGAFRPVSGRYVVPLQGTYIVSCILTLNGTADLPLEAMIAVNGNLDPTTGLWAIQHSGKAGDATLSTAGSIWLLAGQYISVFVSVSPGTSWMISRHSSFSISFNGAGKADSQGFFGVRTQPSDYTTVGWKEVTGWKPRDSSLQSGGNWDPSLSRFTPDEDGLYLITANLILSYSSATEFKAMIINDGEHDKFSAGQIFRNIKDVIASPSKLSLSLSSTVKLTRSQYVSVFVQSGSAMSWSIHGNSSISIVLVSTLTNPHRAGMNAISKHQYFTDTSYNLIRLWEYANTGSAYSVYKDQIEVGKDVLAGKQYVEVEVTGLYFLEVTVVVTPATGAVVFVPYSLALCIETSTQTVHIPSTKLTKESSNLGLIVFGVLYLTKGQQVYPCISGSASRYQVLTNAGFSLVKIVPRGINAGLRQVTDSVTSSDWSIASDWTSSGKNCLYKHGDISSYGATKMTLSKATYFLSSSFVFKDSAFTTADFCVGQDRCVQCYLQASLINNSVSLAGSLRIPSNQEIYTCAKGRAVTITRSAQILPKAGENSTFFYRHDNAMFSSSGVHPLDKWTSDDGRVHTVIMPAEQGLYITSLNLVLRSSTDTSIKVAVTLNMNGKSALVPGLNVPMSWIKAGGPIAFGLSSLVRIPAGSFLSVNVYSDSSKSWEIDANATFSAALLTKDSSFRGISVRKPRDSPLALSSMWLAVEGWDVVNTGAVASKSVVHRGQFVADTSGVYLVMATLSVSLPLPSGTECTIELLLSVDGDVVNSNTLNMSRVLRGQDGVTSRTATLSLSSSVFLSKWQAVFPMVRSTPAHKVVILSDSSFYVTLVDEQRHFSQNCDNTGPHIVFHPSPFQRVAADVHNTVTLNCEAVSDGKITYKWLKNDQFLAESNPSLVINNVQLLDAGRYMCAAESNNITVTSYPAIVQVFETQPVFSRNQVHYNVTVFETKERRSWLVVNFTALTLKEQRANVSFVILSGNTNETFTLDPSISTNETTLVNTSPLDYELVKKYQLTIKATNTDTQQSVYLFVTIDVQDLNDNNPDFRPLEYSASVPEEAWVGALIIQVTAIDMDSDDNGKVKYSIVGGNTGGVFGISPDDGIVFVNKTLDYESHQSYNLTIEARDLGHPSLKSRVNAHVTIRVEDSNDHNPVFSLSKYNFSVPENSWNGSVVGRVHATDEDRGKNGQVLYFIQDDANTFSVNKTSGEISLIGSLDYEGTKSYVVLVTAVDQGPQPRATAVLVRVSVQDANDNYPAFNCTSHSISITECTTVGTEILCLSAQDKDSELAGEIMRYAITEGNEDGTFRVTAHGGIVVSKTLDREHQPSYNLSISASDGGSPPKTSQHPCGLQIHITDANDNFPRFLNNTYQKTLPENVSIGYDVIRVQASDADSGSNALLTYRMDASCSTLANQTFRINETTGIVYTTEKIDFDTMDDKSIRFRIEARDWGSPSLKSFVDVVVMVTDVNDNLPVFVNLPWNLLIHDDKPVNVTLFTVSATDSDTDVNAQITYSIDKLTENGHVVPDQGIFGINSSSGEVFARTPFRKDHRSDYELLIKARDLGSPPFSSSGNLTIRVNDVNDGHPSCEKPLYSLSFPTPPDANTLLVSVNASDKDFGNNSALDYEVILVDESCQANFSIATNGSIYNHDALEPGCEYTIKVIVRDRGEPIRSGQCHVTIHIKAKENSGTKTEALTKSTKIALIVVIPLIVILMIIVAAIIWKFLRRRGNKELTNKETIKSIELHGKSSLDVY